MSIKFEETVPLGEMEKVYIISAMDYFNGSKVLAAKGLGVSVKTLYNKLHMYGLFDKYSKSKVEVADGV
jgi:two-component system response regulator HydG